jgi:IS605 OrfB family transposase
MKITKQTKIRFNFQSPNAETNRAVYEKLNGCIYLTWKAFNRAYNEFIFQHINKQKKGENYTAEENKKFRNSGYRSILDIDIHSSIKASISQKAYKQFLNDTKKGGVLSGSRTWSSYKLPSPIPFQIRMLSIFKDTDGYFMRIPYFSKDFPFNLMIERNEQKVIVDRILSKEYELNDSSIQKDKIHNKWYINLCYSFDKEPDSSIDKSIVVGVDLGIAIPVMCAINSSEYIRGSFGNRQEIDNFRARIKSKRWQILKQNNSFYDLRTGHGKSGKLKPLIPLEDRIKKFMNTYNHKLSHAIVAFALQNKAGIINFENLENLSEVKQKNMYLRDWNNADIITKTEYKAKEQGIEVHFINPAYTSQRCSKCGHIEKENREARVNLMYQMRI